MIDYSDVEPTMEFCFEELDAASRDKYDSERADKTAASFLVAQFKLAFYIEEVEMQARGAKNEVSRIEAEKYYDFKVNGTEKKTENMIASFVAKEPEIVDAKNEHAKQESNLKKLNNLLAILKDGHIYFRNIGKNKAWSE